MLLAGPGGGKSQLLAVWIVRLLVDARIHRKHDQRAVFCYDLHGDVSRNTYAHIIANGFEKQAVYEEARWTDRVFGFPMTVPAVHSDPETQKNLNRLLQEWWLQPTYAMSGVQDGTKSPWIKQYLEAAAAVFFSCPARRIDDVLFLFKRDHPIGAQMIREAADRDAAWNFEDLYARSEGRNLNQWSMECSGAMRRLSYVQNPSVYLRDGETKLEEILKRALTVLRNLSGIPIEAARAIAILEISQIVRTCQEHFNRTGKPLPVTIICDESGALGVVTPLLLSFMQEARKWGVEIWLASQSSSDFADEDVFHRLMGYCGEHYYGRLTSGIDLAADDLCAPSFESTEVHYTREKNVQIGWKEIETASVTKSSHGSSVTKGSRIMPVQQTIEEEYYKTPQLKHAELKKQLSTLRPDQKLVVDRDGVRLISERMLGESHPYGLSEKAVQEAITRQRTLYPFSEPKRWTPKPSAPASEPTQTPRQTTPKAGSGMRRS